jgi:type I restriction enzyme M protein
VAEPCPAGYLTAMPMIRRRAKPNKLANSASLQAEITARLKNIPEQQNVVGPLVKHLVGLGWSLGQIVFGKHEWRVPKSPSEATKREKKQSFSGFPVDIAVFDDESTVGDPRHILFMIECKQPTETAGIAQLESYFVGEPHVRLGIDSLTAAYFLSAKR